MSARFIAAIAIASSLTFVAAAPSAQAQGFGFATFSAVVKANGQTARGSGVQNSKRDSVGTYVVTFTRRITKCTYAASPQGKFGGQASVTATTKKKIRVDTFNKDGVRANKGFTLLVSCI